MKLVSHVVRKSPSQTLPPPPPYTVTEYQVSETFNTEFLLKNKTYKRTDGGEFSDAIDWGIYDPRENYFDRLE